MPRDRGDGRIESALRGDYGAGQQPDRGDGSAQTGYAGPEFGPFECENCEHFEEPNRCNHPEVQADPEVQGQVEAEGCCNRFRSAHQETQAEEHGEGNEEE